MHDHSDHFIEELLEVMFGGAHVISEIFWNVIFALALFGISKARALRKVHKYIDDRHGVTHEKDGY
jgi:hypothetical protein